MKACARQQEPKLILINRSVLLCVAGAMILQFLLVNTQIEGLTIPVLLPKTKTLSRPLRSTAENIPTTDIALETTIQVCGSKDCTRRGGGSRLEKTIRQIVEEKGLSSTIVEKCDCLGECGYGPNIMMSVRSIDDTSSRLVNQMRGREAILQVLGLSNEDTDEGSQENLVSGFMYNKVQLLLPHINVATDANKPQRSPFAFTHCALINSNLDASEEDEAYVNVDEDIFASNDEETPEDVVLGEELDTASVVVEDIHWRVAKLRLEEQNTRRFLKSRPRFLPYKECRKWVQALGRFQSEEDWKEWISMGEKRNPYIPSRPDEYYGRLGQWISWDHFLLERKQRNKKDSDTDAFR